jgi:hypothetical protein
MRHLISILFCFTMLSCTKNNKPANEPFISNIEMDSTNTVKTVLAGQDITSKVRLVVPSVSGDITFLGFEINENPARVFSIKAKALYKPWANQITLPVYQTFDTTVTISTQLTGRHILNFYNTAVLLKSDTVQVN